MLEAVGRELQGFCGREEMIDVLEIKKAIIDKELSFYVGGDKVYCQSDNGDTIQVLDLSEHDKQIRAEVIDKLLDIAWHSVDLRDFRREAMKLKEQNK